MRLLEDRSVVVTGAAQGIGLAIARAMLAAGGRLVLADIREEAVEEAARALDPSGAHAVAVPCDVTDEAQVQALVERCAREYGTVDVMVNNAGITRDATMRRMSVEDFRAVTDMHLTGAWLGTRHAAEVMRQQEGGSIINISSIAGKIGNPGQTNYSAAKAGIVGLTKAAAKEVARFGVRVNAIQPGLIRSPMTEQLREDVWASKVAEIPMGRAGDPAEVAGVAVFLGSDLASYMTGAVIEVSGGRGM